MDDLDPVPFSICILRRPWSLLAGRFEEWMRGGSGSGVNWPPGRVGFDRKIGSYPAGYFFSDDREKIYVTVIFNHLVKQNPFSVRGESGDRGSLTRRSEFVLGKPLVHIIKDELAAGSQDIQNVIIDRPVGAHGGIGYGGKLDPM